MGERAALIDIAFEPVSSNRSLRCGETEFSARRQRGRNDLGDLTTPVQRQNHARQLRQFGANRQVPKISVKTRVRGGPGRTTIPSINQRLAVRCGQNLVIERTDELLALPAPNTVVGIRAHSVRQPQNLSPKTRVDLSPHAKAMRGILMSDP